MPPLAPLLPLLPLSLIDQISRLHQTPGPGDRRASFPTSQPSTPTRCRLRARVSGVPRTIHAPTPIAAIQTCSIRNRPKAQTLSLAIVSLIPYSYPHSVRGGPSFALPRPLREPAHHISSKTFSAAARLSNLLSIQHNFRAASETEIRKNSKFHRTARHRYILQQQTQSHHHCQRYSTSGTFYQSMGTVPRIQASVASQPHLHTSLSNRL